MIKEVPRDEELPHQIRLFWAKPIPHTAPVVAVGCVCRQGRFGAYEVMGYADGGKSPWPIYNDPANHSPHSEVKFSREWQRGPEWTHVACPGGDTETTEAVLDELDQIPLSDERPADHLGVDR